MVDPSKQLFFPLSPYQQLPALNEALRQPYLFHEHPERCDTHLSGAHGRQGYV